MTENENLLQMMIYTRKFWRTQKKDSLISIGMGVVIFALVLSITKDNMFSSFAGAKSGFFSIVSACIWIGIFNSIQLVCREKNDIVKDELDKGLKATSYIGAHFTYQFLLCLVQSLIIVIMCSIFVDGFSSGGVLLPASFEYFLSIFLMVFASDALALVISSIVSTPVVAMTVMPLVLILQLVMAGVIFDLSGFSAFLANFTISKWGMKVMGAIGDMNSFSDIVYYNVDTSVYSSTVGNVMLCWFVLLIFIVASFFISVVALKLTTRRLKK